MQKILKNSWALFLGMGLIMLSHGYQGSLLGVRAVKEEFSLTATGFMLSGYYIGYFIGARLQIEARSFSRPAYFVFSPHLFSISSARLKLKRN